MKIRKILTIGMLAGAALLLPTATRATIVNSVHDFTTTTNTLYWISGAPWNAPTRGSNNVCGSCHTIHHAPDPKRGPLFIHTPTAQTFKTYDQGGSDTFPSGIICTLGSSSLACLSCHDGSVAINSQDSGVNIPGVQTNLATTIKGDTPLYIAADRIPIEVNGGQDDLTHMHPIGVSYADCMAALPSGSLKATATAFATAGSTVTVGQQLKAGKVECASCHDIHRTIGGATTSGIMTIASGQNLCLGCHNK